jgi:uncharacterized membrane protein
MSEFFAFLQLGFLHISDPRGADHILFLLVLAAVYRLREWREALWVMSAFTVGHSITLALAVSGVLLLSPGWIEFLIPVTIVATGAENLLVRDRAAARWSRRYRPLFAGVFGLVHGAGFANYLRSLFVDEVAVPLLGFNVGIELGQAVVLLGAAVLLTGLDRLLTALREPLSAPSAYRLRVVAVSGVVMLVAAGWAVQRSPW